MYNVRIGVDCIKWLLTVPDEFTHCVLTDPAYGINRKAKGTRLINWFETFPDSRYAELFRQLYRVWKPNSHCYVMCNSQTMFIIKPIAEAAGFKFWKSIVWDKMIIGLGYHYRSRHEYILFFEKGKRHLNDKSIPDVLAMKSLKGKQYYPTEKPVSLLEILIKQSTKPYEIVLDPFMGSGSAGVAAIINNRLFMGSDISLKAGGNLFG